MTSVGDGFTWPFQDQQWPSKVIVQGLISLIPIVGWIALIGWLVLTIDHYRTGRRELPPPGFHLERGIVLFLVYLAYAIVFSIPGAILQGSGAANDNPGTATLGNLISAVLTLLLAFLAPSIILHTYRSGFNGGFDLSGIWQMATANAANTVVAALVIVAASFISLIGFAFCCVGAIFTIPYGAAITAGAVTWYEHVTSNPAPA
jgi:Protein of unknown function (DUF4013)